MRSSSGQRFIALDHVRALACCLVVTWHFTHATSGYPVPFEYIPAIFPFALLDEGHTGVALFMTLSGYLFAKLLDGKTIDYKRFLWNRALRLLPLLLLVMIIVGGNKLILGENLYPYIKDLIQGVIFPSLPNGGWSITVEFHYYLVLPIFLWLGKRSKWLILPVILLSLALRFLLYQQLGQIQLLAYWTLVGRIDQFAIGMLIFQWRALFARRHFLALGCLMTFAVFYWYFDLQGGFYQNPTYPSPDRLWIFLPTLEGLAYGIGIAWYDNSFAPSDQGLSRLVGLIGTYSYFTYLFHFFIVFQVARFINERIMTISNFYVACVWSWIFLLLMQPLGYLSFRFIEAPALKLRRPYIL